ncbi:MAG: hypothetical protein M1813_001794 [Trichoglossum hirsutum]|nr:MAG: hypothetical protein M1813_001794 [Trichoglossum hirsutum]
MSSTDSTYEVSEPQDGLSDLENVNAPGGSKPNKRKLQHCASTTVGRRRDTMEPHPAAQCQWSTNHTLRSLSKMVEALRVENSILKDRLRAEGHWVDDSSQLSREPTQIISSGRPSCPRCYKEYTRKDHLLRHIRGEHKELVPFIDQKYCVQCDLSFPRPTDLIRHEKFHHNESYTLRTELFGERELIEEESYEGEHQKTTTTTDETLYHTPEPSKNNPTTSCERTSSKVFSITPSGNPFPSACTVQANLAPSSSNYLPTGCSADIPSTETLLFPTSLGAWQPSESFHDLDGTFLVDQAPRTGDLGSSTAATAHIWRASKGFFDIDTSYSDFLAATNSSRSSEGVAIDCPSCQGQGMKFMLAPRMVTLQMAVCPDCQGERKLI